jgi:hypothetical protein
LPSRGPNRRKPRQEVAAEVTGDEMEEGGGGKRQPALDGLGSRSTRALARAAAQMEVARGLSASAKINKRPGIIVRPLVPGTCSRISSNMITACTISFRILTVQLFEFPTKVLSRRP